MHQTKYDQHRQLIQITDDHLYTETSPMYTLSIYPNDALYEVYATENPRIATIWVVCIILLMTAIFFVYDSFVRRVFTEKEDLLAAKRNFMRFVSHEVRTPLNAVQMGLSVVQRDMASVIWGSSRTTLLEDEQPLQQQGTVESNHHVVVAKSDAAEWLELTNDVLENVESAVEVLTDLLNFDKIEAGTLNLELTQIHIWKFIERSLDSFTLAAENKELDLSISFDNNLYKAEQLPEDIKKCVVVGDSLRLVQVIRNLLSNAIKFTPSRGTVKLRATRLPSGKDTTLERDDEMETFEFSNGVNAKLRKAGRLQLSVQDTGAGMTSGQLDKLFADGVQFNTNELQAGGGTGLGLFISKGIAQKHGGKLWATSPGLGKGATFFLELPLYYERNTSTSDEPIERTLAVPGTSTRAGSTVSSYTPTTGLKSSLHNSLGGGGNHHHHFDDDQDLERDSSRGQKKKILVVDDSDSNRKLLCRLLERQGHVCIPAENGQIAVDLVKASSDQQQDPFDTILLDYEMPVLNGPDTARALRAAGCPTLIAGVTGNVLPEDVENFRRCGANAVLPKPFRLEQLEQLWREYGI